MRTKSRFEWTQAAKLGAIIGIVTLTVALVGMIEKFSERDIIFNVISMGHLIFLFTLALAGYLAAYRTSKALETAHLQGAPGLESRDRLVHLLGSGALAGLAAGAMVAALVLVGELVNVRAVLFNATSELYNILTFGQNTVVGIVLLLIVGAFLGLCAAAIYALPAHIRRSVLLGIAAVALLGTIRDLMVIMLDGWGFIGDLFKWVFARKGLTLLGASVIFVIIAGIDVVWSLLYSPVRQTFAILPTKQQTGVRWIFWALAGILLLLLPRIVGSYPSEVLDMVGLYILMGLGLNIVVGFAGLLDLGYVAFYGIGAYTMALLTSPTVPYRDSHIVLGPLDIATVGPFNLTFWQALPMCVFFAVLAGVLLGIPVLGMRGDYLAIVTLGFGEIIRLIATSDWLKPQIGGPDGTVNVPKAVIELPLVLHWNALHFLVLAVCLVVGIALLRQKRTLRFNFVAWALTGIGGAALGVYALNALLGFILKTLDKLNLGSEISKILEKMSISSGKFGPIVLKDPPSLYYLILVSCLLAAFVSWRLKNSRLGRSWMALREDEDVAEAMGINLVRVKLLAFATGAGFSGLAGAIFASKLTSIYPHSLDLLVSILVLCLIIVGGIGSIPGVVVGSFALIGLPELLREFAEYRFLLYGFVLVLMMLARPEGLWPEARRRIKLHEGEDDLDEFSEAAAVPTAISKS